MTHLHTTINYYYYEENWIITQFDYCLQSSRFSTSPTNSIIVVVVAKPTTTLSPQITHVIGNIHQGHTQPSLTMAVSTQQPTTTTLSQKLLSRPINLQQQSPLYNKIPQEIRDLIFSYALLPYTPASPPPPPKVNPLYPTPERRIKHNPWNPVKVPYPSDSTYSRPGQRAKVHHPTALLLVSRRTYLETAHLPVSQAAHNFYAPAQSGPSDVLDVEQYFNRMTAEQRSLVRQVRVFANVSWLLDGGLETIAQHEAMAGVELLNVVIRWCDWRGWEQNDPLSLRGTHSTVEEVEEEAEEDEGEDVEMEELGMVTSNQSPEQQEQEFFDHADAVVGTEEEQPQVTRHRDVKSAIQAAIAQLPKLKAVRLSLEAPYVKADELEAQIGDIQSWNLHLNGKAARVEEKSVTGHIQRRFEWEAPMCAWSDFCAHCGGGIGDDKACEERKRRRTRKLGPRVQGAVIRWK